MEQDRNGEGPTGAWPWLLLLVVAGLVALAVVMWQSETVPCLRRAGKDQAKLFKSLLHPH